MNRRLTFELGEADLARVLELALERLDRTAGLQLDEALRGRTDRTHIAMPDVDAYRRVRDAYLERTLEF